MGEKKRNIRAYPLQIRYTTAANTNRFLIKFNKPITIYGYSFLFTSRTNEGGSIYPEFFNSGGFNNVPYLQSVNGNSFVQEILALYKQNNLGVPKQIKYFPVMWENVMGLQIASPAPAPIGNYVINLSYGFS